MPKKSAFKMRKKRIFGCEGMKINIVGSFQQEFKVET